MWDLFALFFLPCVATLIFLSFGFHTVCCESVPSITWWLNAAKLGQCFSRNASGKVESQQVVLRLLDFVRVHMWCAAEK